MLDKGPDIFQYFPRREASEWQLDRVEVSLVASPTGLEFIALNSLRLAVVSLWSLRAAGVKWCEIILVNLCPPSS